MNEGVSANLDLQSVPNHPKSRAATNKGKIFEVVEGSIQAPGYAPQWCIFSSLGLADHL
jgi:hypothetical protein